MYRGLRINIRLRHEALVRTLRRTGTSTIEALAAEVGASRRTVLRDIGALRDAGFVIHSESGPGGLIRSPYRPIRACP